MDVRFGAGVSWYSESESRVKVELTDGSSITGRALLACDGWKSCVRSQMLPDDPAHFCNVSMWWASCKITPELEPFGLEEMGFVIGMAGRGQPGSWFASTSAAGDGIWCVSMPAAVEPGSSDDLTHRGGVRGAAVKQEAANLMADRGDLITTLIAATPEESVTKVGLYDRWKQDQPFVSPGGRVALLGDAAHPQTPFLGQGCNMALADAFVTCTRLAHQDVPIALRALDDPERKAFCKEVVTLARSRAVEETKPLTCMTGCLSNMYMKYAPQSMLKEEFNSDPVDEGNKKFVDRALKDCGLSL